MQHWINEAAARLMENDSKIGLLATLDETGCPHLTFLNSLQPCGEQALTFGQFCEGLSKKFLLERPEAAFLALNADYAFVRGRARYTHRATAGAEFDAYNNKPLFRYNAYFGYHTIYYLALEEITNVELLDKKRIVAGAMQTRVAAPFLTENAKEALPNLGRKLFAQADSLKFIAYADAEGYLRITPIIQASNAGSDRIVFADTPFSDEIAQIPVGAKAAILCLTLDMESVLVKGVYTGLSGFPKTGALSIERVYNSMPPKMEYVYPRSERIEPVRRF